MNTSNIRTQCSIGGNGCRYGNVILRIWNTKNKIYDRSRSTFIIKQCGYR